MRLANALEIKRPDPDSHFRLLPCKVCRSENVAYMRHQAGALSSWRVQCLACGHAVDKKHTARHDAQVAWNERE